MHKPPLLRLLLSPSLSSGTATLLGAGGVLGYSSWLYISHHYIFYSSLFGPYGLYTYLWQSTLGISDWYQAFLGSTIAYYLIIGGIAICAGLVVFTALQVGSLLSRGVTFWWQEAHAPGATHRAVTRTLLSRLGLRLLSIAGWTAYSTFFVSALLRAVIIMNQSGIQSMRSGHATGALTCLGAFLFLCLALHVHVVFARLTLLRLRIFGGSSAIEEAEA